ncbi:MAG: hypothetical protein WCI51_02250 [Lentisphaerota bacterium]
MKSIVIIEKDGTSKYIHADVDADNCLHVNGNYFYNKNLLEPGDKERAEKGEKLEIEKRLKLGMNSCGREVVTGEELRLREFNKFAADAGLKVELKTTYGRDESGKCPCYHYTFASGREWIDRNIFDVGRIINPMFSVFGDGETGGIIAGKPIAGALATAPQNENPEDLYVTVNHYNDKAKSRKLTSDEAKEYRFVEEHGFAMRGIRM